MCSDDLPGSEGLFVFVLSLLLLLLVLLLLVCTLLFITGVQISGISRPRGRAFSAEECVCVSFSMNVLHLDIRDRWNIKRFIMVCAM